MGTTRPRGQWPNQEGNVVCGGDNQAVWSGYGDMLFHWRLLLLNRVIPSLSISRYYP